MAHVGLCCCRCCVAWSGTTGPAWTGWQRDTIPRLTQPKQTGIAEGQLLNGLLAGMTGLFQSELMHRQRNATVCMGPVPCSSIPSGFEQVACMCLLYQQAAVARVGCCATEGACVLQCDQIFSGEE